MLVPLESSLETTERTPLDDTIVLLSGFTMPAKVLVAWSKASVSTYISPLSDFNVFPSTLANPKLVDEVFSR